MTCPNHRNGYLKTRYQPGTRLRHGFLALMPWVDILLLLLCFFWVHGHALVKPGLRVAVPEAVPADGVLHGDTLVIGFGTAFAGETNILAYYDDEVFRLGRDLDEHALDQSFASRFALRRVPLTILADELVPYSVVLRIAAAAIRNGAPVVNLGYGMAVSDVQRRVD